MAPLVSVVVAARNAAPSIRLTLDAIERQTHRSFEVLLVDDGSRDGTSGAACGRAEVVRTPRPVGAYAARNRAIARARGDVVAITDADCLPAADWLERLLAALEDADVAGGRIRTPLPPDPSLVALVDAARRLDQASFFEQGFVAFANFACRRELVERVGPFNERLASNGDREWCMRAAARGGRLAYAPDAVVDHAPCERAAQVAATWWRRGVGRGRTPVVGAGPAAAPGRSWSAPAEYLPMALAPRRHPAARRLRDAGFHGGRARYAAVDLATYALAGGPLLAGYCAGAAGARLARRRTAG